MAATRFDPSAPRPVALDMESAIREGSGYRVRLTGPFDAAWIRSYLSAWTGSSFFSRFDLNIADRTVWFALPEAEPQKDVSSVLQILDAMLRMTARRADGVSEPRPTLNARPFRNRLAPAAELTLQLPAPAPLSDPPQRALREPIEDLLEADVDPLAGDDLIEP